VQIACGVSGFAVVAGGCKIFSVLTSQIYINWSKKMTQILKNKLGSKSQKTIELLGGYTAPVALYEIVAQQVEDAMHQVQVGKIYTLEELCGDEFWLILETPNNQRMAGRCFAHMVDQGRFPFEFIQYKNSKTKHYILR
jgi:hypothetical protein